MEYKNLFHMARNKSRLDYDVFTVDVFNLDLSSHDAYELIMVLDGELHVQTESFDELLLTYDIVLINSRMLHKISPINHQSKIFVLQIDEQFVHNYLKQRDGVVFFRNDIENSDYNGTLKKLLIELYLSTLTEEVATSKFHLEKILMLLNQHCRNLNCSHIESTFEGVDPIIQNMILDISASNAGESLLSLNEYALKYGINYYYLSKLFKETTGLTFTAFIRNVRLYQATGYLIKSDLNIIDIAYAVGYNDTKAMGRDFDRVFQLSPSKFRKQYRGVTKTNYKLVERLEKLLETLDNHDQLPQQDIFYDLDFNNLPKQRTRSKGCILDLEQLYYDGLSLSASFQQIKSLKLKYLRIHFKVIKGSYQMVKTADGTDVFSDVEVNELINVAKELDLKTVLCFHYAKDPQCKKCPAALEELLDIGVSRFGLRAIQQWRYELYISDCNQDCDFETVSTTLDQFEGIIQNYVDQTKLHLGLNVGVYRATDHFDESLLKKILETSNIKFLSINYEDCICDDQLPETSALSQLLDSVFRCHEDITLLVDVTFKLSDRLYTQNPYHESLYSLYNLQSYLESPYDYYLVNCRISDKHNTYPFHHVSKYGVETVNYYFSSFYNSLYNDIVFQSDGLTITKDSENDDYSMLIYSNSKNKTLAVSDQDFDVKNAYKVYLKLNNLDGDYRITEYQLDFQTFYYYFEWLHKFKPCQIALHERGHIKSRLIPDLKIHHYTSSLDQNISFSVAPIDLMFVRLEKISR